jgi:hypothetical protein
MRPGTQAEPWAGSLPLPSGPLVAGPPLRHPARTDAIAMVSTANGQSFTRIVRGNILDILLTGQPTAAVLGQQ